MFATLAVATLDAPKALSFTTAGHAVIVPYQKTMDMKEATMELWFRMEPNDRMYNYLLSRNYSDLGYGIALHGRPKVFSQATRTRVPVGEWTHVAISVSSRSHKTYVNGELAEAGARSGPLVPFEHALMIGDSDFHDMANGDRTTFQGQIDEVRLWSKPLTQSQIRKNMKRYLRGNERNLLAYFPFEEGKGQIVHDYSGHLISGTLGDSFAVDPRDPAWAEGVALKGKKPKLRTR